MSPDLVHALTISGSILIAVFLLIVGISVVTVRRGELEMSEDARRRNHSGRH